MEPNEMLTYYLKRTYHADRTDGLLVCPSGLLLSPLERPWKDNEINVSSIPEGTYVVHRDRVGRHTWFRLEAVEGRTAIEIHEGYKVEHSAGCILLDLLELQDLLLETNGESFLLKIYS